MEEEDLEATVAVVDIHCHLRRVGGRGGRGGTLGPMSADSAFSWKDCKRCKCFHRWAPFARLGLRSNHKHRMAYVLHGYDES